MTSLPSVGRSLLAAVALQGGIASTTSAEQEKPPLETLYPFLKDGKWGFIRADGTWALSPKFERTIGISSSALLVAEQGGKLGLLNRSGEWLVRPEFTNIPWIAEDDSIAEVWTGDWEKQKQRFGLISPGTGKILLPAKYQEICTGEGRAFVRSGKELGIFDLSGKWIRPVGIRWPESRGIPRPANPEAAWFEQDSKWGLISMDGKILFNPQFKAHETTRADLYDWSHPEGVDFMDGHAWVIQDGVYQLISDKGKVLGSFNNFRALAHWQGALSVFTDDQSKQGLVDNKGTIILPARFKKIGPVSDGMAVVVEHDGRSGYISKDGAIVVEPGKFYPPGPLDRYEMPPFQNGLAAVRGAPQGSKPPSAGYIDRRGEITIPLGFLETRSFSEGLGGVLDKDLRLWGYVDPSGALAIPAQFAELTPFCRDRAWVLKDGKKASDAAWAMIDRSGKVLTDFAYFPPERRPIMGYDEPGFLEKARWKGTLAVLWKRDGDFGLDIGLANADGKVLLEPRFLNFDPIHDGQGLARKMVGSEWYSFIIREDGTLISLEDFRDVKSFDGGLAWAIPRNADPNTPPQPRGWGLMDANGKLLTEPKYAATTWIYSPRARNYDGEPAFDGELAAVALVRDLQREGDNRWRTSSWGYINRRGEVVAWHEAEPVAKAKAK